MEEFFLKNNCLIQEAKWKREISKVFVTYEKTEKNNKKCMQLVEPIAYAVQSRASLSKGKIGVLFSGGLDSTVIAFLLKKSGYRFTCIAVGLPNSPDIREATSVAKRLGFKLVKKILHENDVLPIIRKTLSIIKEPDVTKVGVGAVIVAGLKLAQKLNIKSVFSGLGSEEIYCGYERHKIALSKGYKFVHKESLSGLKCMWKRDLKRDNAISSNYKISLLLPFLDKNVIANALKISPEQKITKDDKKIILRKYACKIGIPKDISNRKKMAAQYGSRIDRTMEKLAKKSGFSSKKDYLVHLKKATQI